MNFISLLAAILLLNSMIASFFHFIYYAYIFLNKFEKKHNIQRRKFDNNPLSRGGRLATAGYMMLVRSHEKLYKKFQRDHKNDWYIKQYMTVPNEDMKPFLHALWLIIYAGTSFLISYFLFYFT